MGEGAGAHDGDPVRSPSLGGGDAHEARFRRRRQLHVAGGERIHRGVRLAEGHPLHRVVRRLRRAVDQLPVGDAVDAAERVAVRRLVERALGQRHRRRRAVAHPGLDVPPARRVGLVGQVGHDEHEVVGHRRLVGLRRAVHAADVAGDRVAERAEQLAQRIVEQEAVAASVLVDDPLGRGDRIEVVALAERDPHRLERHTIEVGDQQPLQRIDRRRFALDPEVAQVGVAQIVVEHDVDLLSSSPADAAGLPSTAMDADVDPARFPVEHAAPRGFRQAFVRVNPGGVPLLCVHGWPESKRIFWRVIQPLADAGFDVIVPDLRGFGDSDVGPDGFHDVPSHARDLYALVHDELGLDSVVVLGGDLGGPVIQELALRHPEWVDRMVLFNSPVPYMKAEMAAIPDTRPAREASDYFRRQGTDADALAAELATPGERRRYIATFYTSRFWAHPGAFTDEAVDFHTEPFADAAKLRASFGGYESSFSAAARAASRRCSRRTR